MAAAFSDDALRRADDEAVEWAILLRELPGDPDVQARFEGWLAASHLNARAWAATAHAYDRAGDIRPLFSLPVRPAEARPVLPAGLLPIARSDRPPRRRVGRRMLLVSAIATCVAWIAAPSVMLHLHADHMTGTAEIDTITLADGSLALLAPGSAIAIDDVDGQRKVTLLRGEAWFDVHHDAERPFYVEAGGVSTMVLGTAFDVRLEETGVSVELARGHVRVDYAGDAPPISEHLEPGDRVHVGFDGTLSRDREPVDQMASWRERRIAVHDRPASEVIDALRPWFDGIILVRGDAFARQRVTGIYNAADPAEALQGLTQAYGGSVMQISPWVLVVSPE